MKETGKVLTTANGQATVLFVRSVACESCGACRRFDGQNMQATLENPLGAKIGQTVLVELGAKNLLGASAWAYVFPLLMMIAGAILGGWLMKPLGIEGDWFAAVVALLFAGGGFLLLRALNPYFARKRGFTPRIVEVIDPLSTGEEIQAHQ